MVVSRNLNLIFVYFPNFFSNIIFKMTYSFILLSVNFVHNRFRKYKVKISLKTNNYISKARKTSTVLLIIILYLITKQLQAFWQYLYNRIQILLQSKFNIVL